MFINFYLNNINTLKLNMLIEIQMLICDKNLGNILNIYEKQFCFKMTNYDYCTVNFLTEDSEHSYIISCVLKDIVVQCFM